MCTGGILVKTSFDCIRSSQCLLTPHKTKILKLLVTKVLKLLLNATYVFCLEKIHMNTRRKKKSTDFTLTTTMLLDMMLLELQISLVLTILCR